jgi:AbrB family looped-hinge helix DNA binding protein
MRLTIKGQVTIPKKYRQRYGLEPHSEVVFEEAAGGVLIRAAKRDPKQQLAKIRGIADAGLSTREIMKMTRED